MATLPAGNGALMAPAGTPHPKQAFSKKLLPVSGYNTFVANREDRVNLSYQMRRASLIGKVMSQKKPETVRAAVVCETCI